MRPPLYLQFIIVIQLMLENKPTFDVTLIALCFCKKLSCILTSKNLDKQLFFIINSDKVGRCYLGFINSRIAK